MNRTRVPILRGLPLLGAQTDEKQGHVGMSRGWNAAEEAQTGRGPSVSDWAGPGKEGRQPALCRVGSRGIWGAGRAVQADWTESACRCWWRTKSPCGWRPEGREVGGREAPWRQLSLSFECREWCGFRSDPRGDRLRDLLGRSDRIPAGEAGPGAEWEPWGRGQALGAVFFIEVWLM